MLLSIVCGAMVTGITGCGDSYPESLEYPRRDDPIFANSSAILQNIEKENNADWPFGPDPLGVLPITAFDKLSQHRIVEYQYTGVTGKLDEQSSDGKRWRPNEWLKKGWIVDPERIVKKYRSYVERRLKKYFGTPAKPEVDLSGISGANAEQVEKRLKLDDQTLAMGSRLYRIHCLHCHGLTGDGRGPTARWVNPHPRDYRSGLFKFISTHDKESGAPTKPRRADLMRTLREGVEGTSMPSFRLLDTDELEALASYVIHLSIRGEVEFIVLKSFKYNPKKRRYDEFSAPTSLSQFLSSQIQKVTESWLETKHKITIVTDPVANAITKYAQSKDPKELAMSLERGFEVFKKSCLGCHTDFGRKARYKIDVWGTFTKPADLTTGILRGGRRPVDIYYRIHAGIYASGMIPLDQEFRGKKAAWDVINFVRVLPYPDMLKNLVPKVHAQIY